MVHITLAHPTKKEFYKSRITEVHKPARTQAGEGSQCFLVLREPLSADFNRL